MFILLCHHPLKHCFGLHSLFSFWDTNDVFIGLFYYVPNTLIIYILFPLFFSLPVILFDYVLLTSSSWIALSSSMTHLFFNTYSNIFIPDIMNFSSRLWINALYKLISSLFELLHHLKFFSLYIDILVILILNSLLATKNIWIIYWSTFCVLLFSINHPLCLFLYTKICNCIRELWCPKGILY